MVHQNEKKKRVVKNGFGFSPFPQHHPWGLKKVSSFSSFSSYVSIFLEEYAKNFCAQYSPSDGSCLEGYHRFENVLYYAQDINKTNKFDSSSDKKFFLNI